MSNRGTLDLREQVVRIDRAIAETHKLQNESDTSAAEARKMARDCKLSPYLVAFAALTAVGALLGSISFFLRLSGKG